jgi:hypothetical protein
MPTLRIEAASEETASDVIQASPESGSPSASDRRAVRSSLPIVSARTSTIRCFAHSRSYSRVRNVPCTITYEPLGSVRVNSACLPKEIIRCQSVLLCQSPAVSFHVSLVAIESVTTSVPFCV